MFIITPFIKFLDILPIKSNINPPSTNNPVATDNDITAPNSAYTPGNPAAWVAPPPTTVQQALDRMAANIPPVTPIP
jgi:hypothetical protein